MLSLILRYTPVIIISSRRLLHDQHSLKKASLKINSNYVYIQFDYDRTRRPHTEKLLAIVLQDICKTPLVITDSDDAAVQRIQDR